MDAVICARVLSPLIGTTSSVSFVPCSVSAVQGPLRASNVGFTHGDVAMSALRSCKRHCATMWRSVPRLLFEGSSGLWLCLAAVSALFLFRAVFRLPLHLSCSAALGCATSPTSVPRSGCFECLLEVVWMFGCIAGFFLLSMFLCLLLCQAAPRPPMLSIDRCPTVENEVNVVVCLIGWISAVCFLSLLFSALLC